MIVVIHKRWLRTRPDRTDRYTDLHIQSLPIYSWLLIALAGFGFYAALYCLLTGLSGFTRQSLRVLVGSLIFSLAFCIAWYGFNRLEQFYDL